MAKILIVDDEPLITAMMEDWLSELGHLVVGPAHNLATAMELAASEIDVAIVDVSLGKDNSYPLVEALISRGLPFALATGYGARRHRAAVLSLNLSRKAASAQTHETRRATLSQRRVDRIQRL
jgi:DNA-binding NarL/FixJ family response regulator